MIPLKYKDRKSLKPENDISLKVFRLGVQTSLLRLLAVFGTSLSLGLSIFPAQAMTNNLLMPQVLRAVVSETNPVPYAIFSTEGKLMGGISKSLIDTIGQLNQLPVMYLDVPRARVEGWLINNQADVGCFLSPDWVTRPEALTWVGPLFHSAQLVVRRNGSKPILQLSDMYHKRIGTIRGFVYPELEQAFAEKLITRDDAHSLESNLTRLAQGRLDAVMTVDLSLGYVLSKRQFDAQLSFETLWTPAPAIYCAISPQSPLRPLLLKAFEQLQSNGYIDQLLRQYQPNTLTATP